MRKILIATHGEFAGGLKQTMDFVLGGNEKVGVLSAYTIPDFDMDREAAAVVDELEDGDELIVMTDVLGGSVNKEAVVFAAQPGVRVITGMNLTLVATLLTEEELPLDELVKTSIAEAQASIQQPEFVSKEEDF